MLYEVITDAAGKKQYPFLRERCHQIAGTRSSGSGGHADRVFQGLQSAGQ